MKYVLSVDLGTTSMKTVLFDESLGHVSSSKVDYRTDHPYPGWAEQDVAQWWNALAETVKEVVGSVPNLNPSDIEVLAVDAMTPTVVPVDSRGEALRKAIIWMDRRAERQSSEIGEALGEDLFRISGNHNDPSNLSPKIRWIRDVEPEIYKQTDKFLYANAYIVYRLTGKMSFDRTQCGLSQLCDTRKGEYSQTLILGSGLDVEKLPPIYNSTDVVGRVTEAAAAELGLSTSTRVIAGSMDNVAAGLGAGVAGDKQLYISAGTAANVCVCAANPIFHPSFHCYQHLAPGMWIHAAGVDYGGAGYKWFANLIGEKDYAALDEKADAVKVGENPLIFLPYMVGQRAPLWNSNTRGVLFGLDPSMDEALLARSFMEGNAFGIRKILEITRELGMFPDSGRLTGGCSESRVYSQIFADVLGLRIFRVGERDTATLGTAMAAAYTAGFFNDFETMADKVAIRAEQVPDTVNNTYYNECYALYDSLYDTLQGGFEGLAHLRERFRDAKQ